MSEESKPKILDEIFKNLDLKSIIDTSILNALTKEAKDKLIDGILSYLSSTTRGYGNKTHLQEAFETSIYPAIRQQMEKIIKDDPEIMAEIDRCIREATKRFIGMDKKILIDNLTQTMTNAFKVKDGY